MAQTQVAKGLRPALVQAAPGLCLAVLRKVRLLLETWAHFEHAVGVRLRRTGIHKVSSHGVPRKTQECAFRGFEADGIESDHSTMPILGRRKEYLRRYLVRDCRLRVDADPSVDVGPSARLRSREMPPVLCSELHRVAARAGGGGDAWIVCARAVAGARAAEGRASAVQAALPAASRAQATEGFVARVSATRGPAQCGHLPHAQGSQDPDYPHPPDPSDVPVETRLMDDPASRDAKMDEQGWIRPVCEVWLRRPGRRLWPLSLFRVARSRSSVSAGRGAPEQDTFRLAARHIA